MAIGSGAVKVNLLPPELSAGSGFAKASRVVRSLTLVLLSIFLVFGLGVTGFFLATSIQLKNITERETSLKSEIRLLETTETKMVLLKDRIGKIKIAKSSRGPTVYLDEITSILSGLGLDSLVSELTFDSQKIDVSVSFKSPGSLSVFLANLKSSTFFKSIVLTSFGFNPSTGYLVSIRLTPKS